MSRTCECGCGGIVRPRKRFILDHYTRTERHRTSSSRRMTEFNKRQETKLLRAASMIERHKKNSHLSDSGRRALTAFNRSSRYKPHHDRISPLAAEAARVRLVALHQSPEGKEMRRGIFKYMKSPAGREHSRQMILARIKAGKWFPRISE